MYYVCIWNDNFEMQFPAWDGLVLECWLFFTEVNEIWVLLGIDLQR